MKCHAHRAGDKAPCKNWAVKGSTVCRNHGGSAPHVRAAARARLDDMVDPALGKLRRLIESRQDAVSLQAIKDILDRTGYKLPERIESDNATTIRVEYETLEVSDPLVAPTMAEQIANGSYTNGTRKHD